MTHMTTNRPNGKRYFYYRCPKRVIDGPDACTQKTYYKAEAVEAGTWERVRAILTEPATLRDDLNTMIELKRNERRGDPEREAKIWTAKLLEVERKRARF